MQNPIRGLLHGGAAIAAAIGVAWLLGDSPGDGLGRKMALGIFGLTLIVMFTISTLYHTVPWSLAWKQRMQRFDHSGIFLVVAGSYTPVAWIVFDGWVMAAALTVAWGGAAIGIGQIFFFPRETMSLSMALNTTIGAVSILFVKPLFDRLPVTAIAVLTFGALLYLLGMILLVTERPQLWPRVFSYHEVMHVMVVAAAATFWFATWRWVAPFAA